MKKIILLLFMSTILTGTAIAYTIDSPVKDDEVEHTVEWDSDEEVFLVNGEEQPELLLLRGETYTFEVDSSYTFHFSEHSSGGDSFASTEMIWTNGLNIENPTSDDADDPEYYTTNDGDFEIQISQHAPSSMYYQSLDKEGAGGEVQIYSDWEGQVPDGALDYNEVYNSESTSESDTIEEWNILSNALFVENSGYDTKIEIGTSSSGSLPVNVDTAVGDKTTLWFEKEQLSKEMSGLSNLAGIDTYSEDHDVESETVRRDGTDYIVVKTVHSSGGEFEFEFVTGTSLPGGLNLESLVIVIGGFVLMLLGVRIYLMTE